MAQTEWIVSVDDELKDHDELFVGNVRDGDRLTRCRDCKHYTKEGHVRCWNPHGMHPTDPDEYCSRAERAKE